MRASLVLPSVGIALLAGLFGDSSAAQLCQSPSDTFWKNDMVAQVAPGIVPAGAAVLTPMCQGEAGGSYFQVPPGSKPQYLKQVSVGFGDTQGNGNFGAILNIEIFEGNVTFTNPTGNVGMPPKVFDLQADTGLTMNVVSSGISTYDLSPYNIVLDGNFVVAFRILSNISFPTCPSAAVGSAANMLTDAVANPTCTPGKSLLDERDHGWVDPTTWWFAAFQPICPTFYRGQFVIRACTTDAGTWTNLGGATPLGFSGPPVMTGSGPLTVGSFNPVTLSNAPPNALMLTWIALAPVPFAFHGGTVHAFPFNSQLFFFANGAGSFAAAAPWPPGLPSGTNIWWQFVIQDFSVPWQITLSNSMLATTP